MQMRQNQQGRLPCAEPDRKGVTGFEMTLLGAEI